MQAVSRAGTADRQKPITDGLARLSSFRLIYYHPPLNLQFEKHMHRLFFPFVAATLLVLAGCSQSPQRLIEAGNRYHAQKKYREASILYRKAISKDKTNAEAYYREGLNLIDESVGHPDQVGEAASYLRRAIDLKPDNVDATTRLTEIYLAFYVQDPKKFKSLAPEMSELTAKILKNNPNSFDGARLRGVILMVNHDMPNAIIQFEKASAIRPWSRDVVGWLAEAYVQTHRSDDAIKLLRGMIEHDKAWDPAYGLLAAVYAGQNNGDGVQEMFRLRLENNPTGEHAVADLANFYLNTRREAQGEEVIRRTLSDPKTFPKARMLVGDFCTRAAEQERAKDPGNPLAEGVTQRYNKALVEYRAGAAQRSSDELIYQQRIVKTLFALGKAQEALDFARTLAQKNPKDTSTILLYAGLLIDTGMKSNQQQSIAEIRRLVADNPKSAQLHYLLSRAYFDLLDFDKALDEALESLRAEPRLVGARVVAARIYVERRQYGKAIEQTELILNEQPLNPDGRLIKDRALIGLNESDKALPDLEDLVAKYPKYKDARLRLGNAYLATKEYSKAQAQYEKLWQDDKDMGGFLGIQTVLSLTGKSDQALKNLSDEVAREPQNLSMVYALANAQAGLRHYPEAAANYQKILKTNYNSADLWLRLGSVQHLMGQDPQALASLKLAQRANPKDPAAFLQYAVLLDSAGKQVEAKQAYEKVLGMLGIDSENMVVALNNLAFIEAQDNQNLDQALTYAERAKKLAPKSPDVSDTLGFIYYQKNLNAEALRELHSAVDLNPNNATFRLHLAMALLKKGDKSAARSQADRALQLASPDEQGKIKSFMSRIS
jgi:tetratricopeptide (TPR) repeat protein